MSNGAFIERRWAITPRGYTFTIDQLSFLYAELAEIGRSWSQFAIGQSIKNTYELNKYQF
jgi:hypothetical protein